MGGGEKHQRCCQALKHSNTADTATRPHLHGVQVQCDRSQFDSPDESIVWPSAIPAIRCNIHQSLVAGFQVVEEPGRRPRTDPSPIQKLTVPVWRLENRKIACDVFMLLLIPINVGTGKMLIQCHIAVPPLGIAPSPNIRVLLVPSGMAATFDLVRLPNMPAYSARLAFGPKFEDGLLARVPQLPPTGA